MDAHRSRIIRMLSIVTAVLAVGAPLPTRPSSRSGKTPSATYIGLQGGPAQLTARVLTTPVGETTGLWHYHPGYVYNVVTQGTITIEDGCGQVRQYSKGEAFETSEGRVHRAYNLGIEDAVEYNMFVGPPNRPIGVNIPNNEHRCGPPSTVAECRKGRLDRRSTIRRRSPVRAHASRMSTSGSGSPCSFRKTRFREHLPPVGGELLIPGHFSSVPISLALCHARSRRPFFRTCLLGRGSTGRSRRRGSDGCSANDCPRWTTDIPVDGHRPSFKWFERLERKRNGVSR